MSESNVTTQVTIRDLIIAALKQRGIEDVVFENAKHYGILWNVKKKSGKLWIFVDNDSMLDMEVGRLAAIKKAVEAGVAIVGLADNCSISCQIRSDGMWISSFIPRSELK